MMLTICLMLFPRFGYALIVSVIGGPKIPFLSSLSYNIYIGVLGILDFSPLLLRVRFVSPPSLKTFSLLFLERIFGVQKAIAANIFKLPFIMYLCIFLSLSCLSTHFASVDTL